MAAPACAFTPAFWAGTTIPLMLLHGETDLIVPPRENAVRAFERS
jgi:hypothetical protein